jgi:hypothetical protein
MSTAVKYRWAFFILIWVGVLCFTKLNSDRILEILSNREKIEVLRTDKKFQQKNSGNISRALDRQKLFYNDIESIQLGEVTLNNNIKGLITESGNYDFTMEMGEKSSQDNSLPIHMSFNGPLKEGLQALTRMQGEFPFLSFQKVSILTVENMNDSKFDIVVNYRYKLITR